MRRLTLAWLLLTGCLTPRAQLEHDAPACDSFAEFDARAKEQLDSLLAEAPGNQLVRESSRINASRKQCARHVIGGLLERREASGVESVQRELDALTAAWGSEPTHALLLEVLGADVAALDAMLEEAKTKVTRANTTASLARRDDDERKKLEVKPPDSMGEAPEVPTTMCDEPTPCAQLRCVTEREEKPDLAARRCLDSAATLPAQERAVQLAEVLSLLPARPSPARTEARMQLETLQRQTWPEVEKSAAANQRGLAAQLASPFLEVPTVRARVEALREAAKTHHLARARELARWPLAAWLHASLAHEFGGPVVERVRAEGRWAPLRWLCEADRIALPPLPPGLEATLTLKCGAETKTSSSKTDAMRTFELESAMRSQRVEGTLSVTCAGKTQAHGVRIQEPGVEGFPAEAVRHELERLVELTASQCAREHVTAAPRSCLELRQRTPAEVTERFVTHARFNRAWEPCFVQWLEATEGVSVSRTLLP